MTNEADEVTIIRRLVRHDLRGPVTVIVGRADLLLTELQGPVSPEQRRSLQSILASAERLDGLLAELADRIDRAVIAKSANAASGGAGQAEGQ